MSDNRALSPSQVARRLQVSEGRVMRWLRTGRLLGFTTGGKWWTSTLFLALFLEAHANRPAAGQRGSEAPGRLYAFRRRGGPAPR